MTTPLRTLFVTGSALLVAAFLLVLPSGPAQADEGAGRMVLVLDSSGSMKEPAAGGETKIAAAKKALGDVVGSLPEEQAVGLRVYGAEVFSRNDPGACQDSQLVVPVETGNRDQLRQAIKGYKPYGETPIGYALQQAGKDLGGEGKRTVVLVSDGEPTCDPDPCEVARDLAKQGVDLKIDVVGLDVGGNARRQLQCIAGAGNGTYYDVTSSKELAVSLEKLASRAARPYTEIGRAVTGTPTADGAPTISDGDWQDMLGTSEEELVKHYRVKRTIPGSTLHVSAAVRTATGQGEELEVTLSTPQGEDCDYGNAFAQLSAGQLISAGAAAGNLDTFGDVEEASPCASSDTVLAKVDNGAMEVEGPRALEVRVVEEPPVEDPASLPENVVDSASYVAPPAGSSTAATTGGSSFADAPMLEPGVYRDTLVPGEVLTYAVDLEWGQALSAVVEFPQADGKLGDAIGLQDMLARVDIVGPTRRDAANAGFSGGPTNQTFISSYGVQAGAWAGPVAYKNRAEAVGAGSSLAGRYTVSLFLEEDPDRESYLIPITLRLGVEGEATAGPTYTEPAPSASPAPSDGPGSDAPADDSAEETTDSAASPEEDGPGLGLVLGGMGVLALLSAAYLVMRSR